MQVKVAEVIATFPPHHGGMGYVCFHNSLELARRGHEVTVFTLEHGRLSYDSDPKDFRIVRLPTPLLYGDGGPVPQLYAKLKGFDIVHLHYPFFGGGPCCTKESPAKVQLGKERRTSRKYALQDSETLKAESPIQRDGGFDVRLFY